MRPSHAGFEHASAPHRNARRLRHAEVDVELRPLRQGHNARRISNGGGDDGAGKVLHFARLLREFRAEDQLAFLRTLHHERRRAEQPAGVAGRHARQPEHRSVGGFVAQVEDQRQLLGLGHRLGPDHIVIAAVVAFAVRCATAVVIEQHAADVLDPDPLHEAGRYCGQPLLFGGVLFNHVHFAVRDVEPARPQRAERRRAPISMEHARVAQFDPAEQALGDRRRVEIAQHRTGVQEVVGHNRLANVVRR